MKYPRLIIIVLFTTFLVPIHVQAKFGDTSIVKQPYSVAFLSANSGIGIPIGQYKTTGFAIPGVNYSIMAASTIDDSVFGWALRVNYAMNGVDGNAIASKLGSDLNYTCTPVSVDYYSYTTVLFGPYVSFRSTKKFGFDIKVLGGLMYATAPLLVFNAYDTYGNEYKLYTQKNHSSGFCYSGGLGLHYNFIKHLVTFLDFDCVHADPSVSGTIYGEDVHGAPKPNNLSGFLDSPHTIVTMMAGIGFKIPGTHMYNN